VVSRDPALVVCLRTACDSRAVGSKDCHLIGGIYFLSSERLPGAFAAFAPAGFLREEGRDPGVVDEVESAEEDGEEEEVEKNARIGVSTDLSVLVGVGLRHCDSRSCLPSEGRKLGGVGYLQLHIKQTRIRLHNANSLIERVERVHSPIRTRQNSHQQ